MSKPKYRATIPIKQTMTQNIILNGKFGKYIYLLGDKELAFHKWARLVKDSPIKTPTESEFGYAVLRLHEEGLIKMTEYSRPEIGIFLEGGKMPVYKHKGDAGADISSAQDMIIYSGETAAVDCGLRLEIPEGWEVQVRSRSGLAKKGIVVANSPGTIDSGYKGPVKVLLMNTNRPTLGMGRSYDSGSFKVGVGDRIAQLVVKRAPVARFYKIGELTESDRSDSGFGSTGVK